MGIGDDPYNALPQPVQPILGAPRAQYDPFNAGQMAPGGLGMQMALYAPALLQQMFGITKFIPQQSPAQDLLDQMTSAKYMRDSMFSRESMRPIDQAAVYERLAGVIKPSTPLGAAQVNNFAGMMNTDIGQALAGMMIGPQNVEDLFFGRRGSAVQLSNAVNQFGFYRPDSVTGGDRMSGKSLQQFTEQLYSNLYGPGADLNDISGFSAGRTGAIATDLAQRGLLPQSIGAMAPAARMDALRDKSLRGPDFEDRIARDIADETFALQGRKFKRSDGEEIEYGSMDRATRNRILDEESKKDDFKPFRDSAQKVTQTMDDPNSSFEDVLDLPGGASGVRKVDASRVGNKLKEYSGVVASVRAIFGDNGMGNAPMSQLIAALDALAQGGMSSMQPGRLENIMRRTQMSARDSGVSLEALMGLTARGGALADQHGLARDAVPEAVISAMERGRAMRDTGAFTPGFGKMDPNAAMMFTLDQTIRADASNTSRLASTARRIVSENKGNKEFENRAGAKDLIAAVGAMERGESTFVNEAGETVDIAREMGRNPQSFFDDLFSRAGVGPDEIESRYYDAINTQEYLVPGQAAAAQRHEAIQGQAAGFMEDFLRRGKGKNLDPAVREDLALSMGESASAAMIDEVDSSMSGAERVEVMQKALRRGVEQHVRRNAAPGTSEQDIQQKTTELFTGPNGLFANPEEALSYAGVVQADIGRNFEATTGMNINKFRQNSRLDVQLATERIDRKNRARAELATRINPTGDGSNFLQRLSDALIDGGGQDGIIAAALGAVDTTEHQQKLIEAAGGKAGFSAALGFLGEEYAAATVDTAAERKEVLGQLFDTTTTRPSGAGFQTAARKQEVAKLKTKLSGTTAEAAISQYDTAISDKELTQNIVDSGADSPEMAAVRAAYKKQTNKSDAEVEADFADPARREKAIQETVAQKGFRDEFSAQLAAQNITPDEIARRTDAIGLGQNVMTQQQMGEFLQQTEPRTVRKQKESHQISEDGSTIEVVVPIHKSLGTKAEGTARTRAEGRVAGTLSRVAGVDEISGLAGPTTSVVEDGFLRQTYAVPEAYRAQMQAAAEAENAANAPEFQTQGPMTEADRAAAIDQVFNTTGTPQTEAARQTNFMDFKRRFINVPGAYNILDKYTTAISNKDLAAQIEKADGGVASPEMQIVREMYKKQNKKTEEEVEAIFQDPTARARAVEETVGQTDFRGEFQTRLYETLGQNDAAYNDRMLKIGLRSDVATESELNDVMQMYNITRGDTPQEREANRQRLAKNDRLVREMDSGNISAETIMDTMGSGIKDTKQRENVQKAMTAALEQFGDTVTDDKGVRTSASMDNLSAELKKTGISEEEQERIMSMTGLARGQRVIGGFGAFSPDAIASKQTQAIRLNAILESGISGGGKLGASLEKYREAEKEEKEAAKSGDAAKQAEAAKKKTAATEELKTQVGGSDEQFADALSQTGASQEAIKQVNEQITSKQNAAGVVTPGEGAGGPFDGIISQLKSSFDGVVANLSKGISDAFTNAISENFKDLKIENVTITNLNLNASAVASTLFSGLRSVMPDASGSAAASATKEKPDGTKPDTDGKSPDKKTDKDDKSPVTKAEEAADKKRPAEDAEKTAKSGREDTAIEQLVAALKTGVNGVIQQVGQSGAGLGNQQTNNEITGTLRITGMNSAIAHLMPKNMAQPPDGGAAIPLPHYTA